ncbi:polysaccharide deacetylase [Phenylobacterium sp.]|uniref:polysaccharide deacetylase n=1 Tax=Phenylobacterium sp. TaxID=1871053 RepID=UPI00356B579D
MQTPSLWLEAGRWRRAGRTARLWWRDDDAAGPSPRLDRLLAISRETKVPLTLAVVPGGDMPALAARLADTAGVAVVQHGVDHQNRRAGSVAGEFPHDWTESQVEAELRRGWRLIQGLPRAQRVFVPPWNDIHPRLQAALRAGGYAAWSANGALGGGAPARADVHLDLLRWRGGARFRGQGRLLAALAAEMRRRRRAGLWDAPIGLLTHHLVHDEAAWGFLADFLRWTSRRPEFAWVSLTHLVRENGERGFSPVRAC